MGASRHVRLGVFRCLVLSLVWVCGLCRLCGGARPSPSSDGFRMSLFPLGFMTEDYTLAEGMPGVVKVQAWALSKASKSSFGKGIPVLVLDLPEHVELLGARLQVGSFDPWRKLTVTSRRMTGAAGASWIRHEIPYVYSDLWNNRLGVGRAHGANAFSLYLRAKPGSVGRRGMIRAHVRFGEVLTPEFSHGVVVLPRLRPLASPSRHFEFAAPTFPGIESQFDEVVKPYVDYVRNLSAKSCCYRGMGWKNQLVGATMATDSMIGCAKQFPYLMTPESFVPLIRGWQGMVSAGTVPPLIGPTGKKNSDPRATPTWYLVDDPKGYYEEYLRKGCKMYREHYPQLRRFYWDYEPGVDGLDLEGRRRFARTLKLATVPTLAEVTTGALRNRWFKYMVDLHQQHLLKVVNLFRQELPDTEFWLCTDGLHGTKDRIAYWCAVDSIRADALVAGHAPMLYYTGKRYFDDVQLNAQTLKKPVLPLNDPTDMNRRFFLNYTPDKLKQNIVATMAAGGVGHGFWPDLTLSGEYLHRIRDAWSLVAQAEEFYHEGKRCDQAVEIRFRNTVQAEFPYGKNQVRKVWFPDYRENLRYTVHELNGELVLTLLNYHDTKALFVEPVLADRKMGRPMVSEYDGVCYGELQPGKTLIMIPPSGVKVVKIGREAVSGEPADAEGIRRALEQDLKATVGNLDVTNRPKTDGGASASWRIPQGGKLPMLMLKNPAGEQILISAYGASKTIVYWHDAVRQCPVGEVFLHDQSRIAGPYPFVLKEVRVKDGRASALFEYVFKTPDAGGDFTYQDLILQQEFAIEKPGCFTMTYRVTNPTGQAMTLGLRVRNRLFRTYEDMTLGAERIVPGRMAQNLIFRRPGIAMGFMASQPAKPWLGEPLTVRTKDRQLRLEFSEFDGLYVWNGVKQDGFTAEPVTGDVTLLPGQSKSFSIKVLFR